MSDDGVRRFYFRPDPDDPHAFSNWAKSFIESLGEIERGPLPGYMAGSPGRISCMKCSVQILRTGRLEVMKVIRSHSSGEPVIIESASQNRDFQ